MKVRMLFLLVMVCLQAGFAGELEALRERFTAEVSKLQEKKQTAIHEWEREYLQSLLALKTEVRDEGNLDGVLALRQETERFLAERGLPDPLSAFEALNSLQLEALKGLERLDLVEQNELHTLAKRYDGLLEKLQRTYTQQNQIEAALEVKKERERIAADYPPVEGDVSSLVPQPTVKAPVPTFALRIVSAKYGANGKFVDVTSILEKQVKEKGKVAVKASNTLKGDPISGVVKKLIVEYQYQGRNQTAEVEEGQTLTLP